MDKLEDKLVLMSSIQTNTWSMFRSRVTANSAKPNSHRRPLNHQYHYMLWILSTRCCLLNLMCFKEEAVTNRRSPHNPLRSLWSVAFWRAPVAIFFSTILLLRLALHVLM